MRATITAYAKINLLLDVLGKREDGYHEVSMIMQAISLSDRLVITPAQANMLQCDNHYVPHNMTNLAMKAVLLMQERFPFLPPMNVYLEKNIPIAAGLAGGSTNCAAVLMGINRLFNLALSQKQLMSLGSELGSDVPFCLGESTAMASGRGERITPLTNSPKLWFVLVKPKFGVSTPSVYQNLKLTNAIHTIGATAYATYLEKGNKAALLANMANMLEKSTFELHPAVAKLKQEMQFFGGRYTLMSGSGPTVFSAFTNFEEAHNFYQIMTKRYDQVYFSETVSKKQLKERVIIDES